MAKVVFASRGKSLIYKLKRCDDNNEPWETPAGTSKSQKHASEWRQMLYDRSGMNESFFEIGTNKTSLSIQIEIDCSMICSKLHPFISTRVVLLGGLHFFTKKKKFQKILNFSSLVVKLVCHENFLSFAFSKISSKLESVSLALEFPKFFLNFYQACFFRNATYKGKGG